MGKRNNVLIEVDGEKYFRVISPEDGRETIMRFNAGEPDQPPSYRLPHIKKCFAETDALHEMEDAEVRLADPDHRDVADMILYGTDLTEEQLKEMDHSPEMFNPTFDVMKARLERERARESYPERYEAWEKEVAEVRAAIKAKTDKQQSSMEEAVRLLELRESMPELPPVEPEEE